MKGGDIGRKTGRQAVLAGKLEVLKVTQKGSRYWKEGRQTGGQADWGAVRLGGRQEYRKT